MDVHKIPTIDNNQNYSLQKYSYMHQVINSLQQSVRFGLQGTFTGTMFAFFEPMDKVIA